MRENNPIPYSNAQKMLIQHYGFVTGSNIVDAIRDQERLIIAHEIRFRTMRSAMWLFCRTVLRVDVAAFVLGEKR